MDWFNHPQYLKDQLTSLTLEEGVYHLREAWKRIYGTYPSDNSLGILFAQAILETGRFKSMHCWNLGNVKKKHSPDDGYYFTMYHCGEILNGKYEYFDPPHMQTHFVAHKTVEEGVEHYIRFVSQRQRYAKAWQEVLRGNPRAYSIELSKAGYYTADVESYTTGVIRLFEEFQKKKNTLLAWKPKETVVPPALEEPLDTEVDNEPPTDPSPALFPTSDPPEPVVTPPAKQSDSGFFALIMSILSIILNLFGRKK